LKDFCLSNSTASFMKIIVKPSDILELIEAKELHALRDILISLEPSIIAELLITNFAAGTAIEQSVVIFRILPKQFATDIFEFLPFEYQTNLLNCLGKSQVKSLLNEMAADDRTALFEEMPPLAVKKLLNLLSVEERRIALSLLGYPESSVGRLMTPEYIAVKQTWTITQVLEHIRFFGNKSESLDVIYVLNLEGVLLGQIRIRDILVSDFTILVEDLSRESTVSLNAYENEESAVKLFSKHSVSVMPVTDRDGVLLGIVTFDDIFTVAQREATQDIQKFGGSEALEHPYLAAPFHKLVKSRANWLVVLFLGEMLTTSAMTIYAEKLENTVVLAIFLPLIIASGGNSGSQAATLVIRALSLGEIVVRDWYKVLIREIMSGFILGSLLGIVGFLRILVWSRVFNSYGDQWLSLGVTVSFSILFVVMWGTISGAMFPLLLKKLGADPATSSAPFVATVVDVIGLIIYFNIANLAFAK
jgi:magnesium transporter